jgi:Sulfotransferase domain
MHHQVFPQSPMDSTKIFGLGLSRTGTTSLHAALVLLGKSSVHYPIDAARYWLAGNFSADPLINYKACLDIPTQVYYRELDEKYPGSKFILTLRDKERWLDSVERMMKFAGRPGTDTSIRDMIRIASYGITKFNYGRLSRVFDQHNELVQQYFSSRPNSLLVMDIPNGDGWGQLSKFLGLAPISTEFPRFKTPNIGDLVSVTDQELEVKRERLLALLSERNTAKSQSIRLP